VARADYNAARRTGPSCVPTVEVLRLLEREERARLLLLIARTLKQGGKPKTGDKLLIRRLAEHWPGMVPEAFTARTMNDAE
jgi:hypothetical protein